MATKRQIGEALDTLVDDIKAHTLGLVAQYRAAAGENYQDDLLKQAVDTPHRARAQLAYWIERYDASNGTGGAVVFLAEALALVGSTTLASVNQGLAALEAQAQAVVDNVAGGWTLDQAATAIENGIQIDSGDVDLVDYRTLPLPNDYETVWGEPY